MTILINDTCCNCGVEFGITETMRAYRKKDGALFYCPNGHAQRFTETTEAKLKAAQDENERLKQRLAQKDAEISDAHAEAAKVKREAERIRKRIDAGVCPCCNRTFQNLARHMKTKHPEAAKIKEVKLG